MPWIDSHCHVTDVETIEDARAAGVARLVSIGTDADTSRAAIEAARTNDGVWATVGLHPHDAVQGVESIVPLLGSARVVAVGECGLDYHYDHSPRDVQRDAFAAQVALARERGLALVVHTRDAWDDTFAILDAEGAPARTVVHCFTGGPDEARRALDLGAYLSFSGIVTFPKAEDVRAAAARCPLDRVLVETDAPWLTPVPHRGKPNRPSYVTLVGAAIADVHGVPVARVEQATWENAERVFALDASRVCEP
jgi:TatD DNase family protein